MLELKAVVGLGNPGEKYEGTRHNLGVLVVDVLASRMRLRFFPKFHSLVAKREGSKWFWLVKPMTYMNQSGKAVAALCREERLLPGQVLVVVDDVDLPLGQLRLRPRGGAGTHNGLRSIVEVIGEGFPRLRLGIRGRNSEGDLAEYVLSPFLQEEKPIVEQMVERAALCVETALFQGIARAANLFNTSLPLQSLPEDN